MSESVKTKVPVRQRFKKLIDDARKGRLSLGIFRYFDWWLLIIITCLVVMGVLSIIAANTDNLTESITDIRTLLSTQDTSYARLQLLFFAAGLAVMAVILFFDYEFYGRIANLLYLANILILVVVLGMEAGRGGMSGWFQVGTTGRTLQPSEFGKAVMIIALAKAFSLRKTRFETVMDVLPLGFYVLLPMVLVLLQPDFGTALVYIAIFCVLVFVSGADWRLITGVIVVAALALFMLWFVLYNSGSGSYRLTRIMIWLDPENYADDAWQVLNAQKAIGVGGLTGKGIAAAGSLASLGYVSDDHTDFVFSVTCESFGFVGAAIVVILYMLLLGRLIWWANRVKDPFGSYIIMGTVGMFIFHIIENIGMVVGLLPVTGIPLPFMSYGGSSMITCMMCMGLSLNVIMRWRYKTHRRHVRHEISI